MSRVAKCGLVLGTNGTGKSTFMKQVAKKAINNNQRVLVVTPHVQVEWKNVPFVHPGKPERIAEYTGIRKMGISDDTLDIVDKHFRNGILIVDDARAFMSSHVPKTIERFIISRRQRMIDMFFVAHGFTKMPPVFFAYASDIILFRTRDNIAKRKDDLEDFEYVQMVQRRVNKRALNGEPHHKEVINDQTMDEYYKKKE